MYKIKVHLRERSYSVCIGAGILKELGRLLRTFKFSRRAAVITYPPVESQFLNPVRDSLERERFSVVCLNLPAGEETKSLKTVEDIYHQLTSFRMDRASLLVALGGGVIGDITGFVASTYLRGVPYIQIPTTLLAQVDSSVGGKTGVNLEEGKNLVGTFYQPRLILIDTECLKTLNQRDFVSGIAEVIKYGIIKDRYLFSYLQENYKKVLSLHSPSLARVIRSSCHIKGRIVEKDEQEKGIRSILNFGHTIGHALETVTGYRQYSHGEAVAMGMVATSLISLRLGICNKQTHEDIMDLIRKTGLPSALPDRYTPDDYVQLIKLDKKVRSEKIRFIAVERIGRVRIIEIEPEELVKYLV
ncbi:MAG: 3-dehydroquinate synthase [Proteobacteria bacterium]|nr:3-dehydroquinate synthase [Pseudomonadota bacterium]